MYANPRTFSYGFPPQPRWTTSQTSTYESQEIVCYGIDHLLNSGAQSLYLKYIFERMPEWMGRDLVYQQNKLIEQEYRRGDSGEKEEKQQQDWKGEEEPMNCGHENWSTGMIRSVMKPREMRGIAGLDETRSLNQSFASSSMRSSVRISKLNNRTVQNTSIASNNNQSKLMKKKVREESGYTIEKLEVEEIPEDVVKRREIVEKNEDKRRLDRELKFKLAIEEEEKMRKKQAEDEQKQQILKDTKKMLKNRPFTYDFDGKIVFVRHPNKETFPPDINELQINEQIPIEVNQIAYKKFNINIPDYRPKEEPVIVEEEKPKKNKKGYIINRAQTAKPVVEDKKQQQLNNTNNNNNINIPIQLNNSPSHGRIQSGITPSMKSQGSPAQKQFGRKKDNNETDPFLPKSPQLNEILEPVMGVDIKFANGILKTGGEIKKENRMRKSEYQELIENQPKQTYLQELETIPQEVQDVLQEQIEEQDELDFENQASLLKRNKKKVKIFEEKEYIRMMKTQVQGIKLNKGGSGSSKEAQQKLIKKKEKKLQIIKQKDEIIMYKKGLVIDLPNIYEKKPKSTALSKASQLVQQFNKKEIIKNPHWGIQQNKQLSGFDLSSGDQPSTATNFRQKKQIAQLKINVKGEQMIMVGSGNRPVSSKNGTKRLLNWRPISAIGTIATPAHKEL